MLMGINEKRLRLRLHGIQCGGLERVKKNNKKIKIGRAGHKFDFDDHNKIAGIAL